MTKTQIMTMGPSAIVKRYTINFSDLVANGTGTTQTIDLESVPIGTIVKGLRIKSTTVFAGGNSTLTVSVGSAAGSSTTFSSTTYDLFGAVANTTMLMVSGWKAATYAADTIQAFLTAGTNLALFTSGVFWIDIEYFWPEELTATGPAGNSSSGGLL